MFVLENNPNNKELELLDLAELSDLEKCLQAALGLVSSRREMAVYRLLQQTSGSGNGSSGGRGDTSGVSGVSSCGSGGAVSSGSGGRGGGCAVAVVGSDSADRSAPTSQC